MIFRSTLLLSCFILSIIIAQSCKRQGLTYAKLKDDLEVVLELIADRQLSEAELEKATKEYYALFDNNCDSLCETIVGNNLDMVTPMRERAGQPMDLLRRHHYSSVLYFSPTQAGSFIQQLSNETDPIMVADSKSKNVLKHSDIIGYLNINRFIKNGQAPTTETFETETIDNLVGMLEQHYVQGTAKLTRRLTLAAELWTGITQSWNKLSDSEKQQVRNYFEPSAQSPIMEESTYRKLLGLTLEEAADWRSRDVFEHQMNRLNALTQQMLDYHASKHEIDLLYGPWEYWW